MKNLMRVVFAAGCFLMLAPMVFADIAIPTVTTVYFETDGEPYEGSVDYEVNCYGYSYDPGEGEVAPEGYDPENPEEVVYSYSASCPEYGCDINEGYYLNYRHLEYCDLNGEADGEAFTIEAFADGPIPEDCNDDYFDRVCSVTFEIPELEVGIVDSFSDVASSHTYFAGIDYVRAQGIVNGYDDGTYKPDNEINRAEFTKIIIEATFDDSEIENCTPSKTFYDIKSDDWYKKYVCVAANNGIIDGYDDGTFKGGNAINFVEAAKIIVTGFDYDYEEGGEWYEGYVNVLQDNNFIPSTITSLSKQITRGEMAEMIWRIREEITEKASPILMTEPVVPITPDSSDYPGWATYSGDGFAFYHPNWYQGVKWGYDTLSPEYDFIFGDKDGVDAYVHAYTAAGSDLNTSVWFEHPFVESENLTINGLSALMRHYRAPRGTVVNGRTTGEDENIYVYSYKLDGKVGVLQYFNAYGTENKNVDIFFDIADSFYQK
ncbi:MAG: S-layer homology domain-containing protein [Nitrospirota bacterium]